MAKYDVPAMLRYILHHTGFEKLAYIGHSQGTIEMFASLILNHTLPLTAFIGFGPVTNVGTDYLAEIEEKKGLSK